MLEIKKMKVLPSTAVLQLPDMLSDYVKQKLTEKTPEEAAKCICSAVDEIDHGSVQRVDVLVRKYLY